MDEKLSINIKIADRNYPLKVKAETEERIRKAAKTINDRIMLYKQQYTDKDDQDFLAMAALQIVSKMLDAESTNDTMPLMESISHLNRELEDYLNSH